MEQYCLKVKLWLFGCCAVTAAQSTTQKDGTRVLIVTLVLEWTVVFLALKTVEPQPFGFQT